VSLAHYVKERPFIEEWGPPARRVARRLYQKYFSMALLAAVVLHVGSMGIGWGIHTYLKGRKPEAAIKTARLITRSQMSAPPSVTDKPAEVPKFAVAAPSKPKAPPMGIPVPVPEEEAPVATTIASQTQLPFASTEGDTGLGEEVAGGVPWGDEDGGLVIEEEVLPGLDDFVPVEESPVIVEFKTPEYPRLAREAGIEGLVVVRALVGKDGRVKDTVIGKGAHELLDAAALAAAKQCTFKPAIQNKNPVAVWVAIPFNFHLQN
jgi:protein TonB